ncbi:unnamed protein product [Mytilus coruscus]|uniref:Uncharacterized protein n=1 Tax=Mytilus coruscus TaxID=42192 RepID=A0A6J8C2G2_MYTCO|nr:unnamed protein product [Mytilus coruscus]
MSVCVVVFILMILFPPLTADNPTPHTYKCTILYAFIGIVCGPIIAWLLLSVYTNFKSIGRQNPPGNDGGDRNTNSAVIVNCGDNQYRSTNVDDVRSSADDCDEHSTSISLLQISSQTTDRNNLLDEVRSSADDCDEPSTSMSLLKMSSQTTDRNNLHDVHSSADGCDEPSTSMSLLQISSRTADTNNLRIDQQTTQRTQEVYVYVTIKYIQSKPKKNGALLSFASHQATVVYY